MENNAKYGIKKQNTLKSKIIPNFDISSKVFIFIEEFNSNLISLSFKRSVLLMTISFSNLKLGIP